MGFPSGVPEGQFMVEVIEAVLAEVRALRKQLDERGVEQLTAPYREAARILGLKSSKTINRMVKRGELASVMVSGTPMIPMTELKRIATPATPKARRGGAPTKSSYSLADDLAKMKADRRRR